MSAAVTAARANQTKDAIKLFEAARAANPYHRDVLYNLSRLYLLDSAYTKGLPIARQLLAIDPSNPDNYQLHGDRVRAASRRATTSGQRSTRPRRKALRASAPTRPKALRRSRPTIDSAARMTPLIKAYSDSAQGRRSTRRSSTTTS